MKSVTCLFLSMVALACVAPVQAQLGPLGVGGQLVSVRREYHQDVTDVRYTGDLYASPRDRDAYWGYLSVSKETLMAPSVGIAAFALQLVSADGKPIEEARWTEDETIPYEKWNLVTPRDGRYVFDYNLENKEIRTHTIRFGGKVKGGKGSYTKLWLVFLDVTIGKRKPLKQVDSIQFMIYRQVVGRRVDPMTLVNTQEAMGSGGKRLIGPDVEEDDAPAATNGGGNSAPPAAGRYIPVTFEGFSSWVRVEWDDGTVEEKEVNGTWDMPIRPGNEGFNFFITRGRGQRQGESRVLHNGRQEKIPASVSEIRLVRTAN